MSAKYYKVAGIKKKDIWKDTYGERQNYALALKGISEPVKLSIPLPVIEDPETGDTLYGNLIEETASTGKHYYVLELKKPPVEDIRQRSIESQFATRLAVEVWIAQGCRPEAYDNIETEARHFLDVVSNLKGN